MHFWLALDSLFIEAAMIGAECMLVLFRSAVLPAIR